MSDIKLKPIILDQPGINEFYKVFGAGKETVVDGVKKFMNVDEIIARDVASKSSTQMPGLFTYENLKDGTAPLYDLLPLWKDMSIDQRINKLGTNDKIIEFLTRTSKGEKLEFGTMAEGAKRDFLPQVFSLTGLVSGAKIGTQITSKIPTPGGLPGVAIKFGIPTVTSILGAFGAWKGGEFLTSQLFGDEKTILPGTRKAYAQGKTAVGALSWLPLPFLISKNVDFGAAKYLDNVAEMIKKGYVVNQPFSTFQSGVAKQLTTGKAPRTARIIAGIEKMLTASGKFAKANPKATLGVETVVLGSQTTLGGESEQAWPGEALPRIGMELTGSFVPGVLGTIFIDRFGAILQALKNSYKKIKDTGFKEGLNILKQRQQIKGAEKIIKHLEEHGEIELAGDIDQTKFNALIKKLSEIDEFQTGAALTAGLKANSPVLMSIEAALAQTSRGLGKQQKSAISQQGTALRNMIAALIRTGDPVAIKEAMRMSQSIFETAIGTRLNNATQQLLESFSKVKGDDVATNAELGKKLFTMVVEQLSLSRKMERDLWNKVKTVEIKEFFSGGPKRKKLNEPNFIKVFRDEFKNDPEELIEHHGKTIGPLIRYVNRKAKELGLEPVVDPKLIDELAKTKAQDFTKVDNAIDKIIRFKGTKTPDGEILPNDKVLTAINRALKDNNIDPITMADLKDGTKFTKNQMDIMRNYFEVGSAQPKLYLQTGKGSGERNKDLRKMHASSLSIYNQSKKYFEQIAKKVGVEPSPAAAGAVDEVGTVTTHELVKMRGLALSIARGQAGPNGNKTAGGFATQFAKAILDDLNSVPEGANPNYDAARAFSAALNKVYTQTFAGDIVQKTNLGAYKNNPETLLDKLFSGGADATNLRVKQIFEIGNFAQKNSLKGSELLPTTISGTLNMILRNVRAAAIDPDTGEFNQKALQRWMTENKDLLDSQAFQGLKSDLENLDTAKTLLSDTFFKNKNLQKKLDDQLYFKNISGKNAIESPTYIAGMAIAGKNPTRDIRNLSRIAKASKNPEAALNGLYTSMLEYVMTKAGGTSQAFSARSMFDSLFSEMPTALKRTNLSDIMIQNGIATQKQMDNVKRFVTELVKYEAMEAAGKFGADDLIDNLNPILGFYLKISGASIGQFVASKMPLPGSRGMGTGLIESQAGVEIMQRIFKNVPQSMKMDVMGELMQDPVRLAQMLKKVRTKQEAKTLSDSLGNWLLASGFKPIKRVTPAIIREVDEEITGPEFQYDEQSSVQPNVAGSPTTQITARPDSGVNNRIAANVGSPPPAAPNINQRTQLANLFPGDITSGLIKAQQPTQFMQYGGAAYDMGLETDVPAQQSIMSGLGAGYSEDSETNVPNLPSSISYSPSSVFESGITAVRNNPFVNKLIESFKIGPFDIVPSVSQKGFGFTAKTRFADGGIVGLQLGGGVGDEYEDFDYEDAFGPVSQFGTDVSEETKAANRYEDPDEAIGDIYSIPAGLAGFGPKDLPNAASRSLQKQLIDDARGATKYNPYPESIFSKLGNTFGFNVDYRNILGGQEGVDELNELRRAQYLYPEEYTKKDFYAGQPTVRGEAVDVSIPAVRVFKAALPYGLGSFLPGDYLPKEIAKEQEIVKPAQQKGFDLNFSKLFDGTYLKNMFPFAQNFGARTTTNQPTRSYEEEQLMPRPQIDRGYGITELLNVSPDDQIQRNLPLYNSELDAFSAPEFLYELRGLAPSELNVNPFTYGGQQMFDLKNIRKGFGTNTKVVPDGKGGFIVQQLGI
tara:strand:- start:3957 stop:9212 length:5256 start_codon:yes stop_codon:yes gene_type:complete